MLQLMNILFGMLLDRYLEKYVQRLFLKYSIDFLSVRKDLNKFKTAVHHIYNPGLLNELTQQLPPNIRKNLLNRVDITLRNFTGKIDKQGNFNFDAVIRGQIKNGVRTWNNGILEETKNENWSTPGATQPNTPGGKAAESKRETPSKNETPAQKKQREQQEKQEQKQETANNQQNNKNKMYVALSSSWLKMGIFTPTINGFGNLTIRVNSDKYPKWYGPYTYPLVPEKVWIKMMSMRGKNGSGAGYVFWHQFLFVFLPRQLRKKARATKNKVARQKILEHAFNIENSKKNVKRERTLKKVSRKTVRTNGKRAKIVHIVKRR